MLPEPVLLLRRFLFFRAGAPGMGAAGVAVGVVPGVASGATTVCTGEGNGVGVVVGVLKGVEETVGVAVCVGVDVAVWSGTVGVERRRREHRGRGRLRARGRARRAGRRVLGQRDAADHGGVEAGTAEGDGEDFLERQGGFFFTRGAGPRGHDSRSTSASGAPRLSRAKLPGMR